jgi:hypothetical protein
VKVSDDPLLKLSREPEINLLKGGKNSLRAEEKVALDQELIEI